MGPSLCAQTPSKYDRKGPLGNTHQAAYGTIKFEAVLLTGRNVAMHAAIPTFMPTISAKARPCGNTCACRTDLV